MDAGTVINTTRPVQAYAGTAERISVVEYKAEFELPWDQLVKRSRNGHFLLTRRFLEYHGDRFKDRSLLFLRHGKVIAALALNEESETWISHRGLPFGGLIAAPELSADQTIQIFGLVATQMAKFGIGALRYTPTPHVYHRHPFEDDLFALHLAGAQVVHMKLAARARLPELALMQERMRKYLRQAVPRIRVTTEVELGEFWEGLTQYLAWRHQSLPLHTKSEMAELLRRFPDEIRLLGVKSQGGKLLAGSVVFLTDQVIRLQYAFGAASPDTPKAALIALDHAAIKRFGSGRSWIDFGTSMSPLDGTLDEELHGQKERMGARGMPVETWLWRL